jgi:type IV pilus assembly protein PilB
MTVEDPVEYRLSRINQVQVFPAVELDFARTLRAFLRQDPDIILVGEIRDGETARIASQAALTGHLVLATMHTNNALQAVTRLVEIGVEPFIVAPTILGAMAQRLTRKICVHCKEQYKLTPEEIHRLFKWDGTADVFCYRGKGCTHCNHSGYSGRIAIHEILVVDDEMRRLITLDSPIGEIHECAVRNGFRSMRYDGLKKALRGLTTIDEVNRVTFAE